MPVHCMNLRTGHCSNVSLDNKMKRNVSEAWRAEGQIETPIKNILVDGGSSRYMRVSPFPQLLPVLLGSARVSMWRNVGAEL